MAEAPENPFWVYSLRVYARPGVAGACLALQDRHGLDVNLLLFCCWAGERGRALSSEEVGGLMAAVGPWHEGVVKPLRAIRRWLKSQETAPGAAADALRRRIKERELEAEQIEQRILVDALALGEGTPSAVPAAANLNAYLGLSVVRPNSDDMADLAVLLTGCFGDLPPLESMRLLGWRK